MNVSEQLRSSHREFSYPRLGMRLATADLSYDLVIEDLDEAATALAPMCACPSPVVHRRPAITGHTRSHGRQALVTS